MDTSGFYALLVRSDPGHGRAADFLRSAARARAPLVTTDYVLDETATLFKARGHGHLAESVFAAVFGSSACQVVWMDPERFAQTRHFFLKYRDHDWSFTDCFSFGVMRALGLRDALAADVHFRQAGFNPLLV